MYRYQPGGKVSKLVKSMKYQDRPDLSCAMGKKLGAVAPKTGGWHITYVPLHKSRRRTRGFNQSERLARGLMEVTGIRILDINMQRVYATRSQTKKGRTDRWKTMEAAFRVDTDLSEKKLIVVDDVITTGATLSGFCEALSAAGVKSLYVICFAGA